MELELDHFARFRDNVVRVEGKRAIGSSDLDNVHFEHFVSHWGRLLSKCETEDGRYDGCC
jgi:hypothetical protein